MAAIGNVLLKEWDPIGVKEVPEAQDEYEGYIGRVYRLLAQGAPTIQIADELEKITTKEMGLRSAPKESQRIAELLKAIDVRMP